MDINPINILLAAFGIKSLERPLVFISMLVCGVSFLIMGGAMIYMLITELLNKKNIEIMPVLGLFGISTFLLVIAWVSFHFMLKAIKPINKEMLL